MLRITQNKFEKTPKVTYGVEYSLKTKYIPNSNQRVRTQIWDTSGAKQFLNITTTHYRFAVGAFLIYDITNYQSFVSLKEWVQKIREYSDPNVVIVLIANKKDLVDPNGNDLGSGTNFQDVINENEDGEETKKNSAKKIRPNFKIDTVSYEGGSKEKSLKSARSPKGKVLSKINNGLKSDIQ
jgi:small GTP-binding protein